MSRLLARLMVTAAITSANPATAFLSPRHATKIVGTRNFLTGASFSSSMLLASDGEVAVTDAKSLIEEAIADTDRGRSLSSSQRTRIHSLLSDLEALCPLPEPARDPRMEGPWVVLYTDAPPPSNGRLGFLNGVAKQAIDLDGGRYRNELYVGGGGADGDEGAWLTAVLDARWEEWDGVYLDAPSEGGSAGGGVPQEEDPGATTWKVDFESLVLSLFRMPVFTQRFEAGTSRTWRMSYLDDDTRIVRAGKTGRGEDDWIFYMRRGN